MDYLREGIGLRAMGQRDPLTEWQREGFDMFAQMMTAANHDFVRYLLHAEIELNEPAPPPGPDLAAVQAALDDFAASQAQPAISRPAETRNAVVPQAGAARVTNVAYTSSENASVDVLHGDEAPATGRPSRAEMTANALAGAQTGPVMTPVVKAESEKIGRNDPCHCGSGKKFKACHGRAQAPTGASQ